jgi:predicted dehydrogenase
VTANGDRPLGLGVVGFGWMGRVHTTSYRRLAEHFPELGVRPRLIIAADVSPERRQQAARLGFEATTDDWRAVIEHPDVEAISVTVPNHMHREVAVAAIEAGKHVRVEKPVGRSVDDTEAVTDAARRHGVVTTVGFCYRLAPAIQHARELIRSGAIGDVTHFRGTFLADYANRPDSAASWRFLRAYAGSGVLGDLLAHVVDTAHYLVEPIERVTGRTATMIARRPRLRVGEGTHFSRVESDDLVDVENEDWAGALFEFAGGTHGSLEASRVIAGPRVGFGVEVHGSLGALSWNLERMNELQLARLSDDGDEGYTTVLAGPTHPDFAAFQPGAGIAMGYDDLRVIEARTFLASVVDGIQREPGIDEMLACAHVLDAIERSHASGGWEATGIAAAPLQRGLQA